MKDDRIQIKGTKEGINAKIYVDKFRNFDEMLEALLSVIIRKEFYKGSTINIITNLKNFNEVEIEKLKDLLFEEIQIKECTFEELIQDKKKPKFLTGYMKEKQNL